MSEERTKGSSVTLKVNDVMKAVNEMRSLLDQMLIHQQITAPEIYLYLKKQLAIIERLLSSNEDLKP